MSETKITADLSKLESILKDIGGTYVCRVGILGSDAGAIVEDSDGLTMSGLGLIHEFGSETNNIPARSFLRMPLETKQDELIDKIDSGMVKEKIEQGDIKGVYRALGEEAVRIVKAAFPTSGYGSWKANAPITIHGGWMTGASGKAFYVKGKKSSKPLIDKGNLSGSITYDVVKKGDL